MKKFNLEQAKNGAAVCDGNGNSIRILSFDRVDSRYNIVALDHNKHSIPDTEYIKTFTLDGKFHYTTSSNRDLYMKPVEHNGWVIIQILISGNRSLSTIYDTEEEADISASDMIINTPAMVLDLHVVKIKWVE